MKEILCFGTTEIALTSLGGVLLIALLLFCFIVPIKPYLTAIFSGCYVPACKLLSLKLRQIQSMPLVSAYISSKKSKLGITFKDLETLQSAGGNCQNYIAALIMASSVNAPIKKEQILAIEIGGHNSLEIVTNSIMPKQIEINDIKAITHDSIELNASVCVSVQSDLAKFLEGGGEDALIAKVKKFVISKIAVLGSSSEILSKPDLIVKDALLSNIDQDSGFKLLSIEIIRLDICRDVGAELSAKQAEKAKAMLGLEIEKKKGNLELNALQLKTQIEERKAEVLEAEARVPSALAEAIKEGRFSIMDYYKLMNLQADTALRRKIAEAKNTDGSDE